MFEPHIGWMTRCLDLAQRGAGHVSPNPLVGSVVVGPSGQVLGEGWHQRYGGAHAEVHAIADAEARHGADALRTATLYVNLEPCSHYGKTPPCADLILAKEIPRVVVGMVDPNPKVAGGGIARLRAAGVDVTVGVLEAACQRLNAPFVHHLRTGRPYVTLKWAQTLDGCVATATGDSRWVSDPESRALVHRWRSEDDAVLIGSGTARTDDPALTVRHVEGRQPLRVVLDRTGTLPPTLQVFTDGYADHTLAVVAEGVEPAYAAALTARGGAVLAVPTLDDHLDLRALLAALGAGGVKTPGAGGAARRPLQRLLVEAGPGLATALLRADLVDQLQVFVTPKLIGGGRSALYDLGIGRMADARVFPEITWQPVGEDLLFTGRRT